MSQKGIDEKWSIVELVEMMEGFTHYESVVRKVGHDKNNLVPVSHTRVDGDDIVMTTAEKKGDNWYNHHLSLNIPLTIDKGHREWLHKNVPHHLEATELVLDAAGG